MTHEENPMVALKIAASAEGARHGSVMDIHILCDLLQQNGFEPTEFLAGAGISASVLSRPDATVTRRQERDFHALFAAATRHHLEIWVESGRRNHYTAWGDFGMANITAPTLHHIRRLAINSGSGAGRYPVVQQHPSYAGVALSFDLDFAPGTPGFLFEIVRETISGVTLYNELWGSTFPFAYIQVPPEAADLPLSEFIDVPLRYQDGPLVFVWPIELDDEPLPRGNELLHRHYLTKVDMAGRQKVLEVGIDEHVFEVLSQMPDATPGLKEVAAELGLSGRTLQRRLAERGIDFRRLRFDSRLRRAQWMLRTSNAPISEIASSVGYLEVASFSHAFRRWAGESPREYRQRSRAEDVRGARGA